MTVEMQFGLGHQPCVAAFAVVVAGALQPFRLAFVVAHGMCRACRQQRREARRMAGLMGGRGALQGMAVAAFDAQAHRVAERSLGLLARPPRAVLTHPPRQLQGMRNDAGEDVQQRETDQLQQDQQVQRQLDAPRRQHQQHIAVVVARRQRQADGERGKRQQPEQGTHGWLLPLFLGQLEIADAAERFVEGWQFERKVGAGESLEVGDRAAYRLFATVEITFEPLL